MVEVGDVDELDLGLRVVEGEEAAVRGECSGTEVGAEAPSHLDVGDRRGRSRSTAR